MDYEKLHKYTINKLQQMVSCGKITVEIARGICADFVPESEDEKIRKALIDWFSDKADDFKDIAWERIVAWLEKQGEKPNNVYDKELSEILGRVICRYITDPNIPYAEREKVSMEIIPYVERLEKQGKNNMGIYESTRQKLEDSLNKALEKETPESWNEFLDEQKPAWSEEDEKMIQDIINDIAIAQEQVYCKSRCEDEINWLKSLKNRYTWKPSDEQMKALSDINLTGGISYAGQGQELINLYNDLKKLKV